MESGAYCRDVESYLCRKNDGHLIRIVGPAFELVSGWASAAIPLSVVMRAVDLAHARYYAKGPKRRPLRIEYCEADVRDVFDEWKRAIGVGARDVHADAAEEADAGGPPSPRRRPLVAHLDRVTARLQAWRGRSRPAALDRQVVDVVAELEGTREAATTARGDARQRIIDRLAELERCLRAAAHASADEAVRGRLRESASVDLEPFRDRMAPDVFRRALEASLDRLVTEHAELPRLTYD